LNWRRFHAGLTTFALFELLALAGLDSPPFHHHSTDSSPPTYVVARFQNISNHSNGVGAGCALEQDDRRGSTNLFDYTCKYFFSFKKNYCLYFSNSLGFIVGPRLYLDSLSIIVS